MPIDRPTFDIFEDEVREPVIGQSAVEQPGDVRMIERRKDLPFGAESFEVWLGVQPGAEQLEGHALIEGAIGTLVFDQKAGDDLKASIANLRSVSDKISRGEGTLGKLLSDDAMLRDAQAIMKKADRALDGLDDSGPITAVGVVARGLF